jgi:hypothetical protein
MSRINRAARYIKPETIVLGDVIRATVKNKDVEISHVGAVARREHNAASTEYISAEGVTLLEVYRFDDRKIRVTLLDRPADRFLTLPGMEL